MGLETNRGHAQFDDKAWNEWMRRDLLLSEKSLIKMEKNLIKEERALEPIAARTEPYPLPRLPNGRLISIKKAGITLLNVRKQLSSVLEQRHDNQARLRQLR